MKLLRLVSVFFIIFSTATFGSPSRNSPASKKKSASRISHAEKTIYITSDILEARPSTQQVTYKGHVAVVRADLKIFCDMLVVDYNNQKQLKKATCKGNAHLIQAAVANKREEREAWGDVAVFDKDLATLVVTGSPHAREGPNTMEGEKVTYLMNVDRLVVEKPHVVAQTPGKIDNQVPTSKKIEDKKP